MEHSEHGEGWPAWVETWVLPYVEEMALWPVLVALLGHVVVIVVPLMLHIYRNGPGFNVFVLGLFVAASVWLVRMELRARGGPGGLTWVMLGTWLVSFPFAWFAESTGVL
jgi:hypothetical protein